MGFMDKVSAGIKNVDNKIGADIDESKYNSKIRELQREIDEMKSKLGDKIYQAFLKGEAFDGKKCCENIKAKYEEIDSTEKEKQEMVAAAKAERENNRKDVQQK
ncbi:MAG: hypothetical protein RBQ96_02220 [Candidatus Methanomethylophilaceae archaeon]|nr:hypothetical protein [Candidatus Methanomethylophilaceae archaeon]